MASGPVDGLHHELALRYQAILARNGVTVVERITTGADENASLLRDPQSGVDVAFMLGGVVPPAEREGLEMLAALYYEPLWVFYRGNETLSQLDQLRYKRIAIGTPGQGVRAFLEPLLAANNVTGFNSKFVPLGNVEALRALQAGEVDAVCLLGAVRSPARVPGVARQGPEAYEPRARRGLPAALRAHHDAVIAAGDRRSGVAHSRARS